jgi:hypothetical protein
VFALTARVLVVSAALALSGGVGLSDDAASAAADRASWTTATIPKTRLTVEYPSNWNVVQATSSTGAEGLLKVVDPINGDNLIVWLFRGKKAYWYSSLAEYRQVAQASARQTGGKAFTVGKSTIGDWPAFSHIESVMGNNGLLLYGDMDVRLKKGLVVGLGINVGWQEVDVVQGILHSVRVA